MATLDYNDVEGIRASTLKKFAILPGERLSLRKAFSEKDLGRAGDMGSAVHYALENEGRPSPLVHECPWDSYKKRDAQNWRAEIESIGQIALSRADYAKHAHMTNAIWHNAPSVLTGMITDADALREEVLTADGLKCQIDLRVGGEVTDYKTTRHSDLRGISRDFFRLSYDIQAFHYCKVLSLNGIQVDNFYFAFVSSVDPYETFLIRVKGDVMRFGRRRWNQALSTYLRWKDTPLTKLPPMYEEVIDLELPSWLQDYDEDDDLSTFED